MKKNLIRFTSAIFVGTVFCLTAEAEVLDRPTGFKIGDRLTLRPTVSLSLTYDSNPRAAGGKTIEEDDFLWTVSPSLSLLYNAENWSLLMGAHYSYRHYFEAINKRYNSHNYGEDLRWNWTDSTGMEKGWSFIVGESFRQITMTDDMVLSDGSHYSSDSRQFQITGAIQRRFNEKVHADLNGSYYWLDYMNDRRNGAAYYGWNRWTVGAEAGYAASKWTDFIISGSYHGYDQDNGGGAARVSNSSRGCSVQGGIGSLLTDRISYRALAGWSRFDYGHHSDSADGTVYTLTGNWKIGETWNTMLLASSYYQPSERQYASRCRVDAISWGLAKVMVRGKLRATLDLRYRREDHEYTIANTIGDYDYTLDIITGRLGANYVLNRFLSCFAYVEYQKSMNDHANARFGAYDYDRFRATIGITLSY